MKIVTYNVNGLRQRVAQHGSLLRLLSSFDADIICFQETKLSRQDLSVDITMAEGYEAFVSCNRTSRGRSGYSGVATFCRVSSAFSCTDVSLPLEAEEGITSLLQCPKEGVTETFQLETPIQLEELQVSSEELLKVDREGRCVVTDHGHFALFNIYGPRAEDGDEERQRFKLVFFRILQKRLEFHLAQGKRVIVVGDINIAPTSIDRCDAGPDFENNIFRKWLRSLLVEFGGPFFDVFRSKNPGRKEAYTCFSPHIGAEVFNYGSRIDHILIAGSCLHQHNEEKGHNFLECHVEECDILSHFKRGNSGNAQMWKGGRSTKLEGSDHVPVYVILRDIPDLFLHSTPSFSVRYFPEVRGWQQTIVSFLAKKVSSNSARNTIQNEDNAAEAYDNCIITQQEEEITLENNLTHCVSQFPHRSSDPKVTTCLNKEHSSISDSENATVVVENEKFATQPECTTKVKKRVSQLTLRSFFKQPKIVTSDDKGSLVSDIAPRKADDAMVRNDLADVMELACASEIKQKDVNVNFEIHEGTRNPHDRAEEGPCFVDKSEKDSVASQEWQKIQQKMKSTLPLCKGHGEPCVSRSVKKGQNIGRLFYVCARAQGPASNPEANCNHFQWGYAKSKGKHK